MDAHRHLLDLQLAVNVVHSTQTSGLISPEALSLTRCPPPTSYSCANTPIQVPPLHFPTSLSRFPSTSPSLANTAVGAFPPLPSHSVLSRLPSALSSHTSTPVGVSPLLSHSVPPQFFPASSSCANTAVAFHLALSRPTSASSSHAGTPVGVSPLLSHSAPHQFPPASSLCGNTAVRAIPPHPSHLALSRLPSTLSSHTGTPIGVLPLLSHSVPPQFPPASSSRANTPCPLAPAVLASRYKPPRSRSFTALEISQGLNKVNHETVVDRIVEHPLDSIVEYPETGDSADVAVAHVFNVDHNNFEHPQSSFQYSLGKGHGGRASVTCRLLKSKSGASVVCRKIHTKCKLFHSFIFSSPY